MKSKLLLAFLVLFGLSIQAQSLSSTAISATGGYFIAASGESLSATVAEMTMTATFKSTINGVDYFFTQGFQQTDNTENVGLATVNNLATDLLLYPNPTNGLINIVLNYPSVGNIKMTATDLLGRTTLLLNNYNYNMANSNQITTLQLAPLAAGVYFITISFESGNSHQIIDKTYKLTIIKS